MAASPSVRDHKTHCYILKKTTQGEKDVLAGIDSNDNGYHKILSLMGIQKTNVEVERGEFVQPAALPTANAPYTQALKYHTMRDATISFSCLSSDVAPLTLPEYEYLSRAEVIPEKRYAIYEYRVSIPDIMVLMSDSGSEEAADGPPLPLPDRPLSFEPSIGTAVRVPCFGGSGASYYGVVKWIGVLDGQQEKMAGIELENELRGCSDGLTRQGVRYFKCLPDHGVFCLYEALLPDERPRTDTQDTSERSMSPLEDTYIEEEDEKEKATKKHFAEKAKASEDAEQKKLKQMESEKKSEEKRKAQEEHAKIAAKEKALEAHSPSDEVSSLHEQVRKLTVQLEQEKRRRQTVEVELAFERKRSLEAKQDSGGPSLPPHGLTTLQSNPADWQINRNDVMRTRTLGGGAWGLVYEGWYNGHAVAIKEPHLAIMSEDTNKRMEREINIMASIQHPNLVRFIGAVMDEDTKSLKLPPLLVTELMDIDLRSAYKKNDLGSNKLSIFRDIAYALHYLHEHQEPIIHRDVSAPNVLLKTLPNETWQAKLSDFGSANVARLSKTAAEGAIIYSAPETFPPTDPRKPLPKQTTKIDTFSFGILVCEVIVCAMPSPETRLRILENVRASWRAMYGLVIECVRERAEERPTMAAVLKALHNMPNKTQGT